MAGGCTLVTAAPGLGIVELGHICAEFRAGSLDLFEVTGAWVSDTDDPAHQRWFAEATHRHAWHAELWADRSPAIPPVDADQLVEDHRTELDSSPGADRADRYLGWLDALLSRLDEIGQRLEPEFDPSSLRTIALTRADLVGLRGRSHPGDQHRD